MSKKCSRCQFVKPLSEFYIGMAKCKMCKKLYEEEYRKQNKKKVFETKRQYRKNHAKELYSSKKKWRTENKEKVAATLAKWYLKNTNKKKQYEEDYVNRNKQRVLAYRREYVRNRKQHDSLFALKIRIRRLISVSLKKRAFSKKSKTYLYLGCSFEELESHLKETFIKNYGRLPLDGEKLHIDHIVPCATATSEVELAKLQHFSNLQWLLADDNFRKGDSLEWSID